MGLKLVPFLAAIFLLPTAKAETVCGIFKNLKASDGRNVIVSGDLLIGKGVSVIGAFRLR